MPPEHRKLWARRFEIKEALSVWLSLAVSQAVFLEEAWMIVLQLPAFPNGWYFGVEGTPGTASDLAGLAEGGRVILLRVFFRG